MIKKRSKGFTLVELLVTIALMLSLLGIAIVSFINISNNRKEEAYKLVEDQVFTAAEQYLESNIYRFEGYPDNVDVEMDLGTLVDGDYLSVVTDPRTGEKLSKCAIIKVNKKNGRFKAVSLTNNEIAYCPPESSVLVISTPGAPSGGYDFLAYHEDTKSFANVDADKDTGWFNKTSLTKNNKLHTLAVQISGESEIPVTIKICATPGDKCFNNDFKTLESSLVPKNKEYSFNDVGTFDTDGEKEYVYRVEVASDSSKYKDITVDAAVDTEAPNISFTKSKDIPSGWSNIYKDGLSVTANVTDQTSKINTLTKYQNEDGLLTSNLSEANKKVNDAQSGVNSTSGSIGFNLKNYKDGYKIVKVVACDRAGNCSNDHVIAKKDTVAPTVSITGNVGNYTAASGSVAASCAKTGTGYTSNTWKNHGCVTMSLNANDSVSGVKTKVRTRNDDNTTANVPSNNIVYQRKEGTVKWTYKVTDEAGNETVKDFIVKLDRTKPTINVTGNVGKFTKASGSVDASCAKTGTGYTSGSWKNHGCVTMTLTASDNLGNITKKYTRSDKLNEGEKNVPSNNISYQRAENDITWHYIVRDEAGNEATKDFVVKLDRHAPEITFGGDYSKIPSGWSNSYKNTDYNVDIEIKDEVSKINTTYKYKNADGLSSSSNAAATIEMDKWLDRNKTVANHAVNVSGYSDGDRRIKFRACDYTGNCSEKTIVAKKDTTPPTPYTLNISESNSKNYLKDVKKCNGTNCKTVDSYDYTYNVTKCGNGPIVYADSCSDSVSGVDNSTKYVKWALNTENVSCSGNDCKTFTNLVKVNGKWKIMTSSDSNVYGKGDNPWARYDTYLQNAGDYSYTNYSGQLSGVSVGDHIVRYSRYCKDKAGNSSKKTYIRIYTGTGC